MSDKPTRPTFLDVDAAQKTLETQPFTRLLGAHLIAIHKDGCELKVPIRPDLLQQNGFLHGGVVSYAADNALTIAAAQALGAAVVTSEYKINYLRPAQGDAIIARAQCVHAGRSQAVSRCDIVLVRGEEEKLCAVAQGTITLLASPKA